MTPVKQPNEKIKTVHHKKVPKTFLNFCDSSMNVETSNQPFL